MLSIWPLLRYECRFSGLLTPDLRGSWGGQPVLWMGSAMWTAGKKQLDKNCSPHTCTGQHCDNTHTKLSKSTTKQQHMTKKRVDKRWMLHINTTEITPLLAKIRIPQITLNSKKTATAVTLPVADIRPWIPPWEIGFPVTHAKAFMSPWPEIQHHKITLPN